jgi:hypothetical protein
LYCRTGLRVHRVMKTADMVDLGVLSSPRH